MSMNNPRGDVMNEWNGFQGDRWKKRIDVEDFIISNYHEYKEDEKFLTKVSKKTSKVWSRCQKLFDKESITKVLDIELSTVAGIDHFDAGYIDKKNEVIFGLQTDEPLKRIVNPFSGIDTVKEQLNSYGYPINRDMEDKFLEFRKGYRDAIVGTYSKDVLKYRDAKVLCTLPEEYARGKVLALYGADYLIRRKKRDLEKLTTPFNFAMMRTREEVQDQIQALEDIKWMASRYKIDISRPASNAKEAFQWVYFGYLATIKQHNGVINSLGRISTFLDIYLERDLANGVLTEETAQELVDQLVIKLRLVRHLRKSDYKEILIGDPTWVTESIGGMRDEEKSFVTKTSYRFLHTLTNLGSSPEPNFTVLWSSKLPENFQKYVSKMSLNTHVIQFVNDDLLRPIYGRDYAITGAASPVKLGHQMVYYGASCNLPKLLLYAINGGKDEVTKQVMVENLEPIPGEKMNYQLVVKNFIKVLQAIIDVYADALTTVHYIQDKYAYESAAMAFLDSITERRMSFGITGLSTATDSLSAIRYGNLKVTRDESGIATSFQIGNDFPRFGNQDERADKIATDIIKIFSRILNTKRLYRNAVGRISLQTAADHVFYGKYTGATPDGREANAPFAPGASPSNGMDNTGAKNSLASVAKIQYKGVCEDGIANNFSISPRALGEDEKDRIHTFIALINEYFQKGGQHLNVNVISKNQLFDAQRNSEKSNKLIVRYAECGINFQSLNRSQQEELLSRTFHDDL